MSSDCKLALPDFVRLHASGRPSSIALKDAASGSAFSYAQLDRAIGAAVSILRSRRIKPGDRVGALSRNCVELVILQLACARAGAILVPFNWRLSSAELQCLVSDCEPSLLFGDESLDLLGATTVPVLTTGEFARLLDAAVPSSECVSKADHPSLMLYTSGSTGRPKGVVLTERNLFATALNFSVIGEVNAHSAFLIDVPMFHVIGMVTNIRPVLMMGGTVIVSKGFDAATTLKRLSDPSLGISHYFCVPQIAAMLRNAPGFDPSMFRGLKALFTGGAPHPAADIRKWLDDGIVAVDGYGMTEAGTLLGMPLNHELVGRKAGSVGLMPPTIEHRIIGVDGRDVTQGEVGELLVRGPNVFSSYWHNAESTADAFTQDGFFRTGDLVRRDEDGFFFVVDRRKDMFISGGENVYPAEIEAVLRTHPKVSEAAVVGVPDERWGEVGHAFVVLESGAVLDESTLLGVCEAALARYKHPRRIHIVAEMPRTGSGKIAKPELRKSVVPEPGDQP